MNNKPVFDYPLFSMGFRAFFALAGLSALALIALWNGVSRGALHIDQYYPADIWHGHEMLLGYSVAVLAGFLLTAAKKRTGLNVVSQDQLAALSFLWIYGRVMPFYAGLLPNWLIAAVDWLFLPVLAGFLARAILKSARYRYLPAVGLLLLMALTNALIHARILGILPEAVSGLNLLVGLFVVMIVAVAGFMFPHFIERALSGVICIRNPWLDIVAIGSSAAVFGCYLLNIGGLPLAIPAVAALLSNLLRIAAWYDRRIWYVPLLWVLFAGYGWLALGFGLMALAAYSAVLPSLAIHAFTVGGIGVLSLGVMARMALGQTGRVVKASNLMALAFLAINLAALCRVLFPMVAADSWYGNLILISGYGWLAAFSLFLFQYAPVLAESNVTEQSGIGK
ncbi:MAG: NnrS family protein [Methylococcales bacterium]|nr:NnrS family protein [Methylococcales bacterium]